ncbi:MAG: TonB-dependent receptor [Bacteroidaceae bacterium]|jgi:TonB-linked SusC/RagA family outer membrane protein|nr:TonB-dependent receptor [Bacteroidaceae bacterium]
MKRKTKFYLLSMLALLCLIPDVSFAQLRVEGTVKDETGEALMGVAILIQGEGTGAVTDFDGHYVLPSVKQGATLEFSYLGYQTKVVKATGRRLDVSLVPDLKNLDEVVVIAYGQQKKVTITGAVSAVGGDELLKAPVANVSNALQGKLPGISVVQASGMPGDDEPVIRVRGIGSLNSAEPLVLVDGVERSFGQIDPNEIEDISILKDASATAVFGVRGANGVILVTTKRGTPGKASVSVTASTAIQQISKFVEFADSYTYGKMWNYTAITDALPMSQWPGSATIADYAPYDNTGIRFSQDVMEHFRKGDMPVTFPNTNWIDYLMKDAAWQEQVNVNVKGGTDKVRYFVSAGFLNQNSLFKTFSNNDDETFRYKRFNYRANLDIDVSKYSQLALTLGGRVQNRTTMGGGEGFLFRYLQGATPYAGIGIDSEGRHVVADKNIVGPYDRDALSNFYELGYQNTSVNVLNLDLQYKLDMSFLTKGLDFKIKGSYNTDYSARKDRQNGFGTGVNYVATLVDGKEVLRKENITWPIPYSDSRWGNRNWYAEASFNYARKFGKHNVGALLLYNQSKTYYPWDSDGSLYRSIPKGYVGLVGRVTYDYDTRYLFDFNIGYNGSENFAEGKRYGTFPSFSAGWIPSSEKFWEPLKNVIGYLKLRGSWGKVGNDNTNGARFLYLPGAWQFYTGTMTVNPQNRGANFGTRGNWLQAVKELTAGNPNVTWETASKINLGLDAAFLGDRLMLNLDFFWEDRKDILVSNASLLPAVTSLPGSYVNEGRVKNHGYEITLKWSDKVGDFRYSISPSIAFARNKIIEMLEVPPMYDYLRRTGLSVGQRFGYDLFELYQEGTEERYKAAYGVEMPTQLVSLKYGDAVYVDLNGDGLIDQNDQKPLGYPDNPEITWSVNAQLHWKGLDFSMLWVGANNTSRMLNGYYRDQFGSTNTSALTQWVADNSWTEDNRDAILPRISFTNRGNNNLDSRAWIIDSKYVRLKNVEIGYTFNKPTWMPLFNFVRFYASGQNLLTFANFKGNDPEAPGQGLDFGVRYPMTRVFNFGVQVNF